MSSPGTLSLTERWTHAWSPSARINLIRCSTAASPVDNISSNTWTSTLRPSVIKTMVSDNGSSAQINLNGFPKKVRDSQILTPVSPPALTQAQIVRPAPTPYTSSASQVSVFIRTSSVMVILSAKRGKTRTYHYRIAVKSM